MTSLDDPRPAPPVGTARCTVSGTYLTHKWASVWWLNLTTTAPAQADLQTLAGKISSAWSTNMSPILTPGVQVLQFALVWTPSAGQELIAVDTTQRNGTATGGDLNNAASCVVINHRTGSYYRGGHPRSYIPGVPAAQVTNGSTIATTFTTPCASAWTTMVTAIKTGPAGGITAIDVGSVRFRSKNAWLSPPVFVPWQSHACRTILGTQRGRLTE